MSNYIKIEGTHNFKLTYDLKLKLEQNPNDIKEIRELSLNTNRPYLGLKPDKGLYASKEWWDNIDKGIIPSKFISGTIIRTYEAGQEHLGYHNSFTCQTDDGEIIEKGMYYLDKKDRKLFQVGNRVVIFSAFLELKDPSKNYLSEQTIEMAVIWK